MDRFQIKSPQVIHETLDGEVVIVNLETGTYYCLTGTGERIWAAIARGATLDGIFADIRAAYEGGSTVASRKRWGASWRSWSGRR